MNQSMSIDQSSIRKVVNVLPIGEYSVTADGLLF